MNSEQNPSLRSGQAAATIVEVIVAAQECDATRLHSSTKAGNKTHYQLLVIVELISVPRLRAVARIRGDISIDSRLFTSTAPPLSPLPHCMSDTRHCTLHRR